MYLQRAFFFVHQAIGARAGLEEAGKRGSG